MWLVLKTAEMVLALICIEGRFVYLNLKTKEYYVLTLCVM
jgi:hypothetical protein